MGAATQATVLHARIARASHVAWTSSEGHTCRMLVSRPVDPAMEERDTLISLAATDAKMMVFKSFVPLSLYAPLHVGALICPWVSYMSASWDPSRTPIFRCITSDQESRHMVRREKGKDGWRKASRAGMERTSTMTVARLGKSERAP